MATQPLARLTRPEWGLPQRARRTEEAMMATDQVRQPAVDAASEVIGRRVAGALLDFVPLAILFVVMGLLFGESKSSGGEASINLHGGAALGYFALVLVY